MPMTPLWLSLQVAACALLLIAVSGTFFNYLLKVKIRRGRAIIDAALTLPLVLPPVVSGFAILLIFTPGNSFGQWLNTVGISVVFSKTGAILASALIGFPLFYQSLRSALAAIDERIEDVARTLGASEERIFFTISLPLAWEGIVSGLILSFCRALGEFGATILVAGNMPGRTQTLPLAIYSGVESGNYNEAGMYVLIISALTLSMLWGIHVITRGSLFAGRGGEM